MNDKDNTFIFKPDEIEILEDKPHVDRSPRDEYSRARITKARKEEEKPSILPYVAVGLAVVLLITVVLGVLVLRGDISFRKETEDPPIPPVIEVEEEEEPEEEVVETTQKWEITFDPDGVYHMESGNGYAVFADWYDASGKKVNSRKKVYITSETDIRDNGKRISADAFIYIIKNQGGSSVFFQSEVETESDKIISITYDSRGFEEEEPEELPEETEGEEAPAVTPEVPETTPEKEPVTEPTPQEGEAIE